VPVYGKVQILLVMGMMEWASETDKPRRPVSPGKPARCRARPSP